MNSPGHESGFTLIELAIVLVVIGLIVGGVLVGQTLIEAATIRAQISQIDRYNTAVGIFKLKYNGYLPGDIPEPYASQFGFAARGTLRGEGDGDGLLERTGSVAGYNGTPIFVGECAMFWVDLSFANLIEDKFSTATANGTITITSSIDPFLPRGKIGNGVYVYVWSNTVWSNAKWVGENINYFGLSAVNLVGSAMHSTANLSVQHAYKIDTKIDDGLPQNGKVVAKYVGYPQQNAQNLSVQSWAAGGNSGANNIFYGAPDTSATAGSSTTCYDNNNVAGATQQYSVKQNGGTGLNCALSFRLQQ